MIEGARGLVRGCAQAPGQGAEGLPRRHRSFHALLGIDSARDILGHPRCGASWEGFAIHEAVRILDVAWDRCHYWATHAGTEIDLFTVRGGERIGVEAKRTSAPAMTRSRHTALSDLRPDRAFVFIRGEARFRLHERVEAVGLTRRARRGWCSEVEG